MHIINRDKLKYLASNRHMSSNNKDKPELIEHMSSRRSFIIPRRIYIAYCPLQSEKSVKSNGISLVLNQISSRFLSGFLNYFHNYFEFRKKVFKILLNRLEFVLFVKEYKFNLEIIPNGSFDRNQSYQLHLIVRSIDFDDVIVRTWYWTI
jgi:hypothetical protein